MSRLIIVRGLPGSGKSTFARTLGIFHVEADMFCMHNGEYVFDPKNHKRNHEMCQNLAECVLISGSDVVVSNTFTQSWEIEPYLKMAAKHNADVIIYRATGNYHSLHNVPDEVLERMRNRFEPVEGEIIF